MKVRAIAAVMTALVLSATTAFAGPNGSIDIFPYGVDPNTGAATTVNFQQCQGSPTTIFGGFGRKLILGVFARLNGPTLQGISAAECFIEGIETLPGFGAPGGVGWSVNAFYPSTAITAFSPQFLFQTRDDAGTPKKVQAVTFTDVTSPDSPNCQKAALTEIARIELLQTGAVVAIPNDWYIKVVGGNPPLNPNFACPSLLLCDSPTYTQYCVTGGQFIVNPVTKSCNVAVKEATWGSIKSMYR